MDGATHQLHTITPNAIRLKATTDEAKKALDEYTDAKVTVSVCGNWVAGPEGGHLAAYHVSLLKFDTSAQQFRVIALTASLPTYYGCSVVPEDAVSILIYTSVHGPASDADCRQWVASNCGK